jgi:HAD superfamily hydrolase (TIGR01484 family)
MIGIDLDGTLLTKNKEFLPYSKKTVEDALEAGLTIVPVTGRPLTGVPVEILEIPGIRYVITSNGANTYDLTELEAVRKEQAPYPVLTAGSVLRKAHMSHDLVREILSTAPGEDVIREIFVRGVGYHDERTQGLLEAKFALAPQIMAYINRSRKIVPDFEKLLTDESSHVENISLMFPSREARDAAADQIKKIRGRDGGRLLHILFPWKTDLEITHVMADKWRSLEDLGKYLGITDSQIMALGDGDNDRAMLRGAGYSVAMGNAPDYVKETADRITGDNDHDGAAAAIREALGL